MANDLRRYQALIDSIDGIVWEVTPEFKFTFVSQKAERILGYPVDQWLHEPDFWIEHIHPEDRAWTMEFCRERCSKLVDHSFTYRMIAADGRIVWLRDIVHVVSEGKRFLGLRGIMVDVTLQKQAEFKLQEVNARKSAILASALDCIISIDHEGRITEFNPAAEITFGYQRDDVLGKKLVDLIIPFRLRETYEKSLPLGKRVELGAQDSNGSEFPIELSVTRIDLPGPPQYTCFIRNISDQKKQAEELRMRLIQTQAAKAEAERGIQLRDDFLSIAAHELRTPLTPIRMNLQLIRNYIEKYAGDLPKFDFLQRAIHGADREFDRFLKLVENLLDVSRISSGRLILDPKDLDLGVLVKSLVDRFEGELRKSQCEIRLNIQDEVRGWWDPYRMEQVIINLLSNSMKYGEKKPIAISVFRDKDKALLEFTDHGIGISEEDQKKVFNRFERVSSLKHFSGFGLGLFIAKEIVEAHKGHIRLKSELGKGSTFTVELPLTPTSLYQR